MKSQKFSAIRNFRKRFSRHRKLILLYTLGLPFLLAFTIPLMPSFGVDEVILDDSQIMQNYFPPVCETVDGPDLMQDICMYTLNPNACSSGESIDLVVFVILSSDDVAARAVLRSSWSNPLHYSDINIKRMFLIGKSANETMFKQALIENSFYEDILIGNFHENKNIPAIYMGIKWKHRYCPTARWVARATADAFVNVHYLHKFLNRIKSSRYIILCRVRTRYPIPVKLRNTSGDHIERQSALQFYPKHCHPSFYLYSINMSEYLYYEVPKHVWVHNENVFMTGYVVQGIPTVEYINFGKYYLDKQMRYPSGTRLKNLVVSMVNSIYQQDVLWKLINEQSPSHPVQASKRAKTVGKAVRKVEKFKSGKLHGHGTATLSHGKLKTKLKAEIKRRRSRKSRK